MLTSAAVSSTPRCSQPSSSAPSSTPRPPPARTMRLLHLPDDVLARVFLALLSPLQVGVHSRIVERGFRNALPLAMTCRRLHDLFYAQLHDVELWQTEQLDDRGLSAIATHAGAALRRIALRRCVRVSSRSLLSLAVHCPSLRALDLSQTAIGDAQLATALAGSAASRLRALLLRGCAALSDSSLALIAARCAQLLVVHGGVVGVRATDGCGAGQLGTVVHAAAERYLSLVTAHHQRGGGRLVQGVRSNLGGVDVLHCGQIKARPFLDSVRRYCPAVAKRLRGADGKSLRHTVVSALSGLIFHVTGNDIYNGRTAVYFLLVDPGTSNSFLVGIGSSCLDLTNYGCILASCFGDAPNEHVKRTLLTEYGLDLEAEAQRVAKASAKRRLTAERALVL
ncbi:Protein AMN1-like [Gracilariopsis chorda]|uniref:Protein AMN1-like n=1 Tax=Gracilariopsis chorda TaxID=448386 RepID=A0A2V3IVH4_9FLOR|nr:Protein AMN1-like [Gracilariopsis chorda]|eukprot:PXF46146.1 Protein AMN1-like [Gracilariopsis chorda]